MGRLVGMLVIGFLLLGVNVPRAAAEPVEVTYAGTRTAPSPGGKSMETQPATVRFLCEDGVCVRAGVAHPAWRIPVRDGVGRSTGSEAESGDRCGDEFSEAIEWDITIDAERFSGVVNATSDFHERCPNTGDEIVWVSASPYTLSWEGELVTGACVFEPAGCEAPATAPSTTAATPAATPAPAPTTGAPAPPVTSSRLASGDPAARSVVSGLVPPQEVSVEPPQLLLAVALAIILVLLVAFPTALLNSASEEGSDRFSTWWRGRSGTGETAAAPGGADPEPTGDRPGPGETSDSAGGTAHPAAAPARSGWWWAATGVAAAGLISCFVDPQFGINPGSVRLLASVLVGFAIDVALGWAVTIWLVRRLIPGTRHEYVFKPVSLAVVLAAVVLTRVTGFEPGIVFGLVAGVAFGAVAAAAAQGKAALAQLGYAFGAAVLAWLAYGALTATVTSGDDLWSTFLLETLGSIAIGGMAALPIALFPVRGLAGKAIWDWSRWIWAAAYVVGLFAFFVVLMPMPFSWQEVRWSLVGWLTLYLVYLGGALAVWLAVTRPWRKEAVPAG